MKSRRILFGLIIFTALCVLMASGCASSSGVDKKAVLIEAAGNLSSVRPGGSLALSATGRDVSWKVSSSADGLGPVSNGTVISADGVLEVAENESHTSLFVIAVSLKDKGRSDIKNIRVVTVSAVKVEPEGQPVITGRTFQFRAPVTGTNNPDQAVSWKVSSDESGAGSVAQGTGIDEDGLLTVADNEKSTILFITAASVVDPSVSDRIPAAVVTPIVHGVNVSPANHTVRIGRTIQFTASVTGVYEPSNAVTWKVSSNPAGTGSVTPGTGINEDGLLTVAENETITTLYIIAASVADPTKAGNTSIAVVRPAVSDVIVDTTSQSITAGGVLQFTSSVVGDNDPDNEVKWRVSSTADGTGNVVPGTSISASGLLTVSANEVSQNLFIFAESVLDPSKSGSKGVSINIVAPIVSSVSIHGGESVEAGGTLQFTASVTGINNPGNSVKWKVTADSAGNTVLSSGTAINSTGLLTVSADETLDTLYITAISDADPSKSDTVSVTVIK